MWVMASGKWLMASGKWLMASGIFIQNSQLIACFTYFKIPLRIS